FNRELEAKDGLQRHFEVGWEAVAAAVPAYRRHVEAEIARLGAHHPIVQTQYLLRSLGRAGRFLDATQLTLLRGTHPPQVGPGPASTSSASTPGAGRPTVSSTRWSSAWSATTGAAAPSWSSHRRRLRPGRLPERGPRPASGPALPLHRRQQEQARLRLPGRRQ